jgi:hypothetical protein
MLPPRQLADRCVLAPAEREHVEPVVAAEDRVRLVEVLVDDAVAGPDLVRLLVHPCQSGAAQHVEDLLRLAVDVCGGGHLAGAHLDPLDPAAVAPRGTA